VIVEHYQNGEYYGQITYPVPQQRSSPVCQWFDTGDLLHVLGAGLTLIDGKQHVHGTHKSLGNSAVERHLVAQIAASGQFHQLRNDNKKTITLPIMFVKNSRYYSKSSAIRSSISLNYTFSG